MERRDKFLFSVLSVHKIKQAPSAHYASQNVMGAVVTEKLCLSVATEGASGNKD